MSLKIKKRNGEDVSFNPQKIYNRVKRAAKGLNVNSDEIFIKVITSVPTEGLITTKELDKLIYEIAAAYTGSHHDYSRLASSVAISAYHKETDESFCNTMHTLHVDGIINDKLMETIELYGPENIDSVINHENDYNFDYFAWKSLSEMYLLKTPEGRIIERPQHMYMRVALWVTNTYEEAIEYYNSLSNQRISKATPIMINAGTRVPQLASCVLHYNNSDSREGLLKTLNDISTYSSDAAGIGLSMSNIRSKESRIKSSGGFAGGLLKYLKIVNESLRFFNQQGRRPGSAAIYLEPWHRDIMDLLEIKKNTGAEELRARDLFTALWIPDNFMRAVKNNEDWYLFCPNEIIKSGIKPLQECYGDEYEENYQKAVDYMNEKGYYKFIVFSDDIEYCKSIFNDNNFQVKNVSVPYVENDFLYSEGRTEVEDLAHMANCSHNIVANSTFSYSASWLNRNPDKIVITPNLDNMFVLCNEDMIPDSYIQIVP